MKKHRSLFQQRRWLGWMCPVWAVLCLACGQAAARSSPTSTSASTSGSSPYQRDVQALMRKMSLPEKVGQLLMVGFGGTRINRHMRHWVGERRVGGVALFSRNLVDVPQIATLTRDLMQVAHHGIPPFLALDQEGGNVVRIKQGAMVLPGNMALGATGEPGLAYMAGQALAIDLRLLGFSMNLAPVLDVNNNPKNPVIGIRSYGEQPDKVGQLGAWFIRGQQEMGLASVAKHFPGHGDTAGDSHFSMPTVQANKQRLDAIELLPFRMAIDAGLDAIMTAHIALPLVAESSQLPATLSYKVLTGILRQELGFEGVLITDGLEMAGIVQRFGSGKAAVMAILAGADMPMVLWSDEAREEVYQALMKAAYDGTISSERLDASVRRILLIKAKRGLLKQRLEPLETALQASQGNALHHEVAARIAQQAVTLVRHQDGVLPLDKDVPTMVLAPPGPFGRLLQQAMPKAKVWTMPYVPTRAQRSELQQRWYAICPTMQRLVGAAINRYHVDLIQDVQKQCGNLQGIFVSFASPYYLELVPKAKATLCTYSYVDAAQEAAADALLGRWPISGHLPITLGAYGCGHGLLLPAREQP